MKKSKKVSLLDLAGVLTNEEAEKLEKDIKEMRKRSRKRLEKTAKKLKSIMEQSSSQSPNQ